MSQTDIGIEFSVEQKTRNTIYQITPFGNITQLGTEQVGKVRSSLSEVD